MDSYSSINTLLQRGLIDEVGRLEIPGRPLSYKTTTVFLRSFNLKSINDLPDIKQQSLENLNYEVDDDEYNN